MKNGYWILFAAMLAWAAGFSACGTDADDTDNDADAGDVPDGGEGDGDDAADLPTEEPAPCTDDDDCDNGVFCDGEETCGDDGECQSGDEPDCDDADPCTMDFCDADSDSCDSKPKDEDDDGYIDETCDGTDCNDDNPDIYPGAPVGCTADDDDCNGNEDHDNDDDGHDRLDCEDGDDCNDENENIYRDAPVECDSEVEVDADCNGNEDDDNDDDGALSADCEDGTDCDDSDGNIYPGADPACGADHDCNGYMDNDNDNDGYVWEECPDGDDCDDSAEYINPGGVVECRDEDYDCNGHPDNDQDGDSVERENEQNGWPACGGTDCNDDDDTVHPGAVEICDDIDQNCNDDILDAVGADDDGDTVLDEACGGGDCDDTTDRYHSPSPDSPPPDVCTPDDYDCNGETDDMGPMDALRVDDRDAHATMPAVAWSGTEYGVVWADEDSEGNMEIFFRRVDAEGVPIETSVNVSDDAPGSEFPAITWCNGRWGIVWQDDTGAYAYFITLSSDGATRQPDWSSSPGSLTAPGSDYNWGPRIASNGSDEFGIVWSTYYSTAVFGIYFATAGLEGTLGIELELVDNAHARNQSPDITWSSGKYGVVWEVLESSDFNVYFDLVDASASEDLGGDGEVCLTNEYPVAGEDAIWPRIAAGTVNLGEDDVDGFAVTWVRQEAPLREIHGQVVSHSGDHSAHVLLSTMSNQAYNLPTTMAWNGVHYGVAWLDGLGGPGYQIFFARMDVAGSLAGEYVLVASDNFSEYPALAWNDENFGIAWRITEDEVVSQILLATMVCTY